MGSALSASIRLFCLYVMWHNTYQSGSLDITGFARERERSGESAVLVFSKYRRQVSTILRQGEHLMLSQWVLPDAHGNRLI